MPLQLTLQGLSNHWHDWWCITVYLLADQLSVFTKQCKSKNKMITDYDHGVVEMPLSWLRLTRTKLLFINFPEFHISGVQKKRWGLGKHAMWRKHWEAWFHKYRQNKAGDSSGQNSLHPVESTMSQENWQTSWERFGCLSLLTGLVLKRRTLVDPPNDY